MKLSSLPRTTALPPTGQCAHCPKVAGLSRWRTLPSSTGSSRRSSVGHRRQLYGNPSNTYRENSHANHTWHPRSHQTACFLVQGSAFPVGSIPIAGSTSRLAQVTLGNASILGPASYLEVSLRCPSIHTYSHTQQFPRIICVNPTLVSAHHGFLGPQSDPLPPPMTVGYREARA
jgi:hypothetical protein